MTKFAMLSAVQAAIIVNARQVSDDQQRKDIKAHVFADVKQRFGIRDDIPIKAEVDPTQPDYLVVKAGKKCGRQSGFVFPLDDNSSIWTGVMVDPAANAVATGVSGQAPDNRVWFKATVASLIELFKAEVFLDSDKAVDLPADAVVSPLRDDFAAAGDSVYIKAEPDNT